MVPSFKQERDMNIEMRELNDTDLETVAGGMDCRTAIAVSKIYISVGDILNSLGNSAGAAGFYGQATGVLQGACPA
ncbi:MAG: hypothetical protein BGN91_14045 [Nitrobacter sp. 62-13]|nr:MAG: hypothetical protein BGN91_14045 [Nitrobacter sp. 62-13]